MKTVLKSVTMEAVLISPRMSYTTAKEKHRHSSKKTLTYERAEAFYGMRMQLATDAAMRHAAHSMLAMWQAAHNTDYYTTKYGTQALEQL